MTGRGSRLRSLAALALTLGAWLLGAVGHLLPLHPYAWADDARLGEQVDPDVALVALLLCTLGCVLAALAAALAWRLEAGRGAFRVGVLGAALLALVLCAHRLAEVLPVYSG